MSESEAIARMKGRVLDALQDAQATEVSVDEIAKALLACVATVLHGKMASTRALLLLAQMFLWLDEKKAL